MKTSENPVKSITHNSVFPPPDLKTKGRAGLAAVNAPVQPGVAAARAVELTALSILTGLVATGLALPTRALTMLQPSSASTNAGEMFPVSNLINQSGLSAPYISGVTDFSSYTSSTTHASYTPSISWVSSGNNTTGVVTFDLGSTHTIEAFALWNDDTDASINGFELLADADGIFGNGVTTSLGSFNATQPTVPILAQTFTFSPTSTQFVHLNITSNNGNSSMVGAAEAAFGETTGAPYEFSAIPGVVLLGAGYGANYLWKRWKDKDNKDK